MTTSATPPPELPPPGRRAKLALLIRLVINLAAPVLAYAFIRPYVHSDITALVLGAAIPTAYTAAVFLWRRSLDVIGLFAIACFAIGLLLVVATGGSELVFKLREDIWTGPLGLAFLISTALRRPLFFAVLQLIARRNTGVAERLQRPRARRICTVSTWVIGVILLVHALALVILALATTTTTFLALSRPISLAIVGAGLVPLVIWTHHQRPSR